MIGLTRQQVFLLLMSLPIQEHQQAMNAREKELQLINIQVHPVVR